jgi:hypothetical protein
MKFSTKLFTAAAIAGVVALPISSVSFAQSTMGSPNGTNPAYSGSSGSGTPPEPNASGADSAPNASGAPQAKVDDATLQQVARAFVKVRRIGQSEQHMLAGNGDQNAKQQAAQQAESEKVAAVKAEGLEPQRYNEVMHLVQADNGVQQRFLSYVKQVNNS